MSTIKSVRRDGRALNQLRPISFEIGYLKHAEGSCLVRFGNTWVLCTATVEERLPPFLKDSRQGWVTAEYSMLPRATLTRTQREISKGHLNGRTQEIQRLIGRSLRAAVDLKALGERQIIVDCDVIQADGGTRTAAITGGFVALCQALQGLHKAGKTRSMPLLTQVAAVSCGVIGGNSMLDLEYEEDVRADVDSNFVIDAHGKIVEIQGTAEARSFTEEQLQQMLSLAKQGISELIQLQQQALLAAHG